MPWTQKQMLRDANGDLIPQYWDVAEQDFKPLTGQGGANDVRLTGSIVEKHEDIRAITNTSYNSFDLSSDIMSRYRDIEIYVMNTLQGPDDEPVKVRLAVRPYPEYVSLKFGDVFERISSSSTSAHSEVPYSNALINLKDLPPAINGVITDDSEYYKRFLGNALRIEYNANAAPTKGEMTIWVIGVK